VPNTLISTIAWAQPYIQYSPLTAGTGFEPAASIASMIQNSILNPPLTWSWNRIEDSSQTTQVGKQDYLYNLSNFGFMEKISLTDQEGKIWELKDIYNTEALSKSVVQQRPSAAVILNYSHGASFTLRFLGVPNQVYTINLTYQGLAIQFSSFQTTAVANTADGNTIYTGVFIPSSFVPGEQAYFAGFTNAVNNGLFTIISSTSTLLTVANSAGILEVPAIPASSVNVSWAPIPDQYSDVYNNLFLSEAFQTASEPEEAARYRQRGVAALLAKSEGLTQVQYNAFLSQWLTREDVIAASALRVQQAGQARGV
jgi:hypothetical protein